MKKLVFLFFLVPLFVGCVPFKANKPIQVSQVNMGNPKPNLKSLRVWRAKQIKRINEMAKEFEKESEREYESGNPILSGDIF
jgi:hypothetical protein